jgi:hypothetical protein
MKDQIEAEQSGAASNSPVSGRETRYLGSFADIEALQPDACFVP